LLNADIPLHHQIYLHLRAEIADGTWAGRDGFPGEIEIADRFGVSVITSRRALNRLSEEGYIERSRGKRTKVVREPAGASTRHVPEIIQISPGAPRAFTYRVLTCGIDVAPAEACAAFGMVAGSRLWMCSRMRSYEGRPHSITLNVQRAELGESLPLHKLQKYPMTQILRDTGISFSRLSRTISATLAPPHVAKWLGLSLDDPALLYTFTQHDAHGVVIQWVRIWVRGNEPSASEVFSYETGTWTMGTAM